MLFRRILTAITLAALILSCFSLASCQKTDKPSGEPEVKYGRYIYVSEDGNDSNSGDESSPVRTLAGAVEVLRKIKAEGLPEGGVCVTFAKGNYPVTSTAIFTSAVSGEEGKPIVFKGEEGAVIDGGVTIPAESFSPVSEAAKAKLPTEEAKANVLEADLAALGVTEFGDERTVDGYAIELFCDTARQTVARYPNKGEYYIAKVGDCSECIRQSIPEGKAALWAGSSTISYYGYPVYDWSNFLAHSDSIKIDVDANEIQILSGSQCNDDKPYYVFNLIEELDSPGEYYIDPEEKKLYYYPEGGSVEGKHICVTSYTGNFMEFGDVSRLTFDSLTFENARNCVAHYLPGETVPDSNNITFKNCTARDVSMECFDLCGYNIVFENCEMYELGCGGITISTDNENSLNPSDSSVTNCYIHEFSRVYTVYKPAVTFYGYGFYCGHNEFCVSTHEAVAFNCSGSLFEYNYIHDVCSETSDAGAVYSGRRYDFRQNIIRYNIIENIIDIVHGGGPKGIYCDDDLAETTCYGNIICNVGGSAFVIGGGRDNTIYNNIIINAGYCPINMDDRGLGWAWASLAYPTGCMWECLLETPYLGTLHRYAFPKNLVMSENYKSSAYNPDAPGTPAYNYVCRNVAINCTDRDVMTTYEEALAAAAKKQDLDPKKVDIYSFDYVVDHVVNTAGAVRRYSTITDNKAYYENPGIADYEHGDYRISEDSVIYRDIIGFEPIPVEKIGRE